MGHYPEDTEEEKRHKRGWEKAMAQHQEEVIEIFCKLSGLREERITAERVVENFKKVEEEEERTLEMLLKNWKGPVGGNR